MSDMSGGPALAVQQQVIHSAHEWRGMCLDIFAKHELAVIAALEKARDAGIDVKIAHLAGQRLKTLKSIAQNLPFTDRQRLRWESVMDSWDMLEARRAFLAHGKLMIALTQSEKWVALLDVRIYRSNAGADDRWTVLKSEAAEYLCLLDKALKEVVQQLGVFHTHLPQPLRP